jgi:phi LC3 family holin
LSIYYTNEISVEGRVAKLINWKVRFKNKSWVIAFVSQILIVVQMIIAGLNIIGAVHFQLTNTAMNDILGFVNAVLIVLSMLGIVQDPTTKGIGDSQNALKYEEPK